MGDHAKFSPSKTHLLLKCPGMVNTCAKLPRAPSSPAAMTGNITHKMAELCLTLGTEALDYVGYYGSYNHGKVTVQTGRPEPCDAFPDLFVVEITESMCESVQVYVDEVRRIRNTVKGISPPEIERRVDLNWLIPGMFGTLDSSLSQALGTLYINDYKNGYNNVEVDENPQLMAYALGVLGKDNPDMIYDVNLGIIQPNGVHYKGSVRRWSISTDDLYKWGYDVLKPGILAAQQPGALRLPGPWCKDCYCEAYRQSACPEVRKLALESVGIMFDDDYMPVPQKAINLPDAAVLTGDQINHLLDLRGLINGFFDNVHDEAYNRHSLGRDDAPSQWKLVPGKASRSFKDEKVVEGILTPKIPKADLYTEPKFKTVAQVEAALKKNKIDKAILADHIEEKRGTSLVRIEDNREAKPNKIIQMFG